jgi:hypothetical protein
MKSKKISDHEAKLAGNILNVDWDKVSYKQFKKGLEVELEHGTKNPELDVTKDDLIKVAKIALAHLDELPDYYTKLAKVEKDLKEGATFGRAVDFSVITEDLINRLAKKLNLGIENMNPKEIATGVIDELGQMMTYNENDLNYEKLSKAMLKACENIKSDPGFYTAPAADTFAHVLTGDQFGSGIAMKNEAAVKAYVEKVVSEDLSDMLKTVKSAPEQAWQKVKQKFSGMIGKFKTEANNFSGKLSKAASQMNPFYSMIKQTEKETGEKFPLDSDLKIAIGILNGVKESQAEVANESKEVQNVLNSKSQQPAQPQTQASQTQQQQQPTQKQESYLPNKKYLLECSQILSEAKGFNKTKQSLNESVTAATVIGFVLALISGIAMLAKAFHKLAKKFGMEKTAKLFNDIHHTAHTIEHKTIDIVVPDRLSYGLYSQLWKQGFKLKSIPADQGKKIITFEEYKSNKYGARNHVESLLYKFLLAYFLVNGTIGAIKSGVSLLGVAESAASTVKAVEIATAASSAVGLFEPTK